MSPEGRTERWMKVTPILCKKGESISSIHANNPVKIARDQLVPNQRENDQVPVPLEGAFPRSDQLCGGEVTCRGAPLSRLGLSVVLGCWSEEREVGSLVGHRQP